jgi:hypothetical protein
MDDYYQFLWYRSDDHGNGPGEATPLAGTPALAPDGSNRTVVSATGAIERTADTDVLMFAAAAGTVRFTMSLVPPDTVTYPWRTYSRSNLDLKLQVFSGTSLAAPLATFDPQAGLLSGSYTFAAPAEDVYYVVLTGVGQGADASSGYTAYGSLGEYSLTTDFPTAPHTQLPPTTPPQPSPPPPPRRRSQPPAPLPSQPPPDPSSLVLKATGLRAYRAGARWRAAVTFAATASGGPARNRALALGVTWSVVANDTGTCLGGGPVSGGQAYERLAAACGTHP